MHSGLKNIEVGPYIHFVCGWISFNSTWQVLKLEISNINIKIRIADIYIIYKKWLIIEINEYINLVNLLRHMAMILINKKV